MFATNTRHLHHPETQSSGVTWHCASNMAVNLTDLSLPQLEGLKTQLEQVRKFLLEICCTM